MKSVHKTLKLRHKKHTGKLLHHKHTSYRVLFGLMLLPIIMFAMVSQIAKADDYILTAIVPAPLPSGAPTIISPANGATFTASDISVSGTCPVIIPAILIALHDDAVLIGSGQCSPTGQFSIPVSMTMGVHTLIATVTNFTGQVGASSVPVTVTRVQVPTPGPGSTPNPNPGSVSSRNNTAPLPAGGSRAKPAAPGVPAPLVINSGSQSGVIVFGTNNDAVWRGSFSGGFLPYFVTINWGDGVIDKHTVIGQTEQTFSHHYTKLGRYEVRISIRDSDGNTAELQMVAASSPAKTTPVISGDTQQLNTGFLWPRIPLLEIYIFAIILLLVLWYIEHGRHKVRSALLARRSQGPRRV